MNTYKKYCPNVFVAQCEEKHEKGDTIIVETRYGKQNKHIVHNFVGHSIMKEKQMYCYSITRVDGYNNQERAKKKIEKLNGYADNADKRSNEAYEKSKEGRDFLSLGEPIKVGHHSEKRHRALIERNWQRMAKSVDEADKAKAYRDRTVYWERMTNKIDLSMPESLEFFTIQLEEAKECHKFLKDNPEERPHGMALTYSKKKVNELIKKCNIAQTLWG